MIVRHSIILAINSIVLAILGIFCFWQYFSYKADVEHQLHRDINQAKLVLSKLVKLEVRELSGIANSISQGSLLRSALSTEHAETINGVLTSIAQENSFDVIYIKEASKMLYSNGISATEGSKPLQHKIIGSASIPNSDLNIVVARIPQKNSLDAWSEIINGSLAFKDATGKVIAHNLKKGLESLLSQKVTAKELTIVSTENEEFYMDSVGVDSGDMILSLYLSKQAFWQNFIEHRNSLIVIGSSLVFISILLSVFLAKFIEQRLQNYSNSPSLGHNREIIEKMEKLRSDLLLQTLKSSSTNET